MNVSQDIALPFVVGLIEKLKTQPAKLYNSFNSRWDETYSITLSNSALNQLHK